MPKIDKMLEMMTSRNIERAILISDRPFQLYSGGGKVDGPVTPAAQLQEVIAEVAPAQFAPMLHSGGAFHFVHQSTYGAFDVGVENYTGTLQISIAPSLNRAPASPPTPYVPPAPPQPQQRVETPRQGFQLADDVANSQSLALPQTANANAGMGSVSCVLHPGVIAAGVCTHSGKFYCSDCLVEVNGKNYGKENLGSVMSSARPANQIVPQIVTQPPPPPPPAYYPPPPPPPRMPPSYLNPGYAVKEQSHRSKAVAALLAFFVGALGIHNFYLGHIALGMVQLLLVLFSWVTCFATLWIVCIWVFIEFILILCGVIKDAEGRELQ